MQQKLSVERLYRIADFENLKITSELTEIPQQIFLNEEAQDKIRKLLLVDVEFTWWEYTELLKKLHQTISTPETLKYLKDIKSQTFNELCQLIKSEDK